VAKFVLLAIPVACHYIHVEANKLTSHPSYYSEKYMYVADSMTNYDGGDNFSGIYAF
jgi:hypothetical protein